MRGSDLFKTFRGYGEMEIETDRHQREKKGGPSPGALTIQTFVGKAISLL